MQNAMQIDFKQPYGKCRSLNIAKQKVFYVQNGIDYDASGKACNQKQIQAHYKKIADNAQAQAEAAKKAAEDAASFAKEALAAAKGATVKKAATG